MNSTRLRQQGSSFTDFLILVLALGLALWAASMWSTNRVARATAFIESLSEERDPTPDEASALGGGGGQISLRPGLYSSKSGSGPLSHVRISLFIGKDGDFTIQVAAGPAEAPYSSVAAKGRFSAGPDGLHFTVTDGAKGVFPKGGRAPATSASAGHLQLLIREASFDLYDQAATETKDVGPEVSGMNLLTSSLIVGALLVFGIVVLGRLKA